MDNLISVKGLVIRTTPVIPDMKEGKISNSSGFNLDILLTKASSILHLPNL